MDEKVKARLIGATVLVVIAVVLVPELLSGPKSPPGGDVVDDERETRTYTIDLDATGTGSVRTTPVPTPAVPRRDKPQLPTVPPPGAATAARESMAAGDASKATTPARSPADTGAKASPVANESPRAEPVAPATAKKVAVAPKIAAPPPAPVVTKPAPASTKGGWAVQVGAFGSVSSARKLVADLGRDGFTAYVAPLERGGKTLHRVRVGPQPTRTDADRLATRLKQRGLPAAVVAAE